MPRLRVRCQPYLVGLVDASDIDHFFPFHTHHSLILGLVTCGKRQMIYAREEVQVMAGQIFVVHPGEAHACRPLDCRHHDYRVLCVSPEFVALHFPDGLRLPHVLPDPGEAFYFSSCLAAALTPAAETSLLAFIKSLAGRYALPALAPVANQPAVEKARLYLEDHTCEPANIQDLGRVADLSPYHLNRLFRRSIGLPPHTYQLQVRIQLAQHMLASGKFPLDVAYELGFSDQSHFSRFFKKYTGLSPAAYRRQNYEDGFA